MVSSNPSKSNWSIFCLKHEISQMIKQGYGSIVNVSSGAGLIAVPSMAAYCASKHALLGLTKTAATENLARGIRVNSVLPGSTKLHFSTKPST